MRSNLVTGASALIILATVTEAKHGAHEALEALHRRHKHARDVEREANITLAERGVTCAFPTNAGLVAVTPNLGNGGWAFASDQSCTVGRYCPYACPSGQVSMQWDPSVTTYSYPGSMNGGLLCGPDGTVTKPFPDRPYCQTTATNIGVLNNAGSVVNFCQTVLPGNEDMLIPTTVTDWSALAVPDITYWAGTAAHYYINPPGVSATDGCVWGSNAKNVGNWAPYVAGANADSTGETFIKLGWNPIYLEPTTPFRNVMPTWGVKIDCPNGGCNGLPCAIDPTKNSVNEMVGSSSDGAGGGAFCVVTVSKGSTANFIITNSGAVAGQFYESNGAAASSSTNAAPASSSSIQATSSSSVSSHQSTTTFSSTKAISTAATTSSIHQSASESNETNTSWSMSPSEQPYYSLFNSTATAKSNGIAPTATAANTLVATHTGGAAILQWSAGLGFGLAILVTALLK